MGQEMTLAQHGHPDKYSTRARDWGGLVALLPLGLTIFFLSLIGQVASGTPWTVSWAWVPSLGVTFSFYVDGLALLMALLVSGIGTLIFLYGGTYLAGDSGLSRFFVIISIFMIAMVGLVTAGNLLTLFLFWELTSISSYLLIGYKHKTSEARDAALQALLVTGGGGLALLAGLVLLGSVGGSYEVPALLANAGSVQAHPLYGAILLLILAGAFTKSAQFPFHFWLPGAMAAPTPVSAYLHSATMVKAGVYLLARLSPVLGDTAWWMVSLVTVGAATMIVGAWIAWQQHDLKRILAYSTVSGLGTLVMLIGVGTEVALKAAMVFLLVHSLYKAALFMVAGSVDHATHSRDVRELGGLARAMPYTAAAAALAALSMAGMIPFLGFVSKELLYEATLEAPQWATALTALAVASNVFNVVAAGLAAYKPFAGARTAVGEHAHEGGWQLVVGPLLLASLGLAAGFLLTSVGNGIIQPAVSAVAGAPVAIKLYLWHGVNTMLILSIITLALGALVYVGRDRLLTLTAALPTGERWGPTAIYNASLDGLKTGARGLTMQVQNGQLRRYVQIVLATTTVVLLWGLWRGNLWPTLNAGVGVRLHEATLAVMMIFAALVAVSVRSRLAAVVGLGVVGLGVTLIFAFFSAPDLAMTQFAIETLTVLLFVFVLYRLPRFATLTAPGERMADALVAGGLGLVMALLVLIGVAQPHPGELATFFAESSYLQANGRNVVNVILVDFRSLDTLGEITVLGIAAIGVYTLMKLIMESAPQAAGVKGGATRGSKAKPSSPGQPQGKSGQGKSGGSARARKGQSAAAPVKERQVKERQVKERQVKEG